MQQQLKVYKNESYEERRQEAFDQLNDTYEEEGIPFGAGEFKINHLLATMMAKRAFREKYGALTPKFCHIPADELPGTEVHPGVYIKRDENSHYSLVYEDAFLMEDFIQMWL